MQQAATEAGMAISEVSMKGILDLVTTHHHSFQSLRFKQRQREQFRQELISVCATRTLVIRPFRQEPRAKKRRSKPYQLLTAPRDVFYDIPHKENYRKPA
ncbi:MAG: hypothetical protein HKN82_06790 [Akkermansiaceae bacterium]|nr:hypothetical protein [Akkermansiaceae bacterium]